jgi:hypothetical protein
MKNNSDTYPRQDWLNVYFELKKLKRQPNADMAVIRRLEAEEGRLYQKYLNWGKS